MGPLAILSGIGAIFGAVGDVAKGWFAHKTAKIDAARDVELAEIRAGVEVQAGSFKDEYLLILWTLPLIPAIFDAVLHWDPSMSTFLRVVESLPLWYTSLLITITGASFGVRAMNSWKSGKLERELTWDRHEKNGKANDNKVGKRPVEVPKDPYAAVRPSPLPPEG